MLKTSAKCTLALLSLSIASLACGADIPQAMKTQNTEACKALASKFDPLAPKDQTLIPKYCECVTETYWASVPQADFDAMTSDFQHGNPKGPGALAVSSRRQERMQAAKMSCGKQ